MHTHATLCAAKSTCMGPPTKPKWEGRRGATDGLQTHTDAHQPPTSQAAHATQSPKSARCKQAVLPACPKGTLLPAAAAPVAAQGWMQHAAGAAATQMQGKKIQLPILTPASSGQRGAQWKHAAARTADKHRPHNPPHHHPRYAQHTPAACPHRPAAAADTEPKGPHRCSLTPTRPARTCRRRPAAARHTFRSAGGAAPAGPPC